MKLFTGQLSSFCEDIWEICEIVPKSSCFAEESCVTYNLWLCERAAKELFGSKTGGQILQIYKILNVLHIFIYFGYFFRFMYSYQQMMATLMQADTEAAATAWSSKK